MKRQLEQIYRNNGENHVEFKHKPPTFRSSHEMNQYLKSTGPLVDPLMAIQRVSETEELNDFI